AAKLDCCHFDLGAEEAGRDFGPALGLWWRGCALRFDAGRGELNRGGGAAVGLISRTAPALFCQRIQADKNRALLFGLLRKFRLGVGLREIKVHFRTARRKPAGLFEFTHGSLVLGMFVMGVFVIGVFVVGMLVMTQFEVCTSQD